MRDSLQVSVDKTTFIEVSRIFERVYRPDAANVILALANGILRIEFHGAPQGNRPTQTRSET